MSAPDINDQDIALVVQALKSGQLSMGPFVEQFEQKFSAYIGARHAIAVSSGTAGLHLCMHAANLRPGDEVITSPFSFVASANCILYEGAKPVFVDIDEATFGVDPSLVANAINQNTRAILPIHVFGQPCAMDELLTLASKHELLVFEDACEAVGAEYRGRKVGSFGKANVFAFYPNKQMTTGEGGIILTDDDEWAEKFRSLRNQGRSKMGAWLHHEVLGFNYRMSELSAALGCSQISRIDELLDKRQNAANHYQQRLAGIPGVRLLQPTPATTRMSWFVMLIRLDPDICRDSVMQHMQAAGIPTRTYFSPIHLQPFFREKFGYQEGDFPVTESVAKGTLALPFFSSMAVGDIDYVADCLKVAIAR
ncbi:DegT/DnrJ/EryC1/StrS family aminotransferase [Pseudomonas sp. N040]|nr:DegT/DnrJ/EryC1/StrS family aminotransferase [Pseudomonas sp. N040]